MSILLLYIIIYLFCGTAFFAYLTTQKKEGVSIKDKVEELSDEFYLSPSVVAGIALFTAVVFWPFFLVRRGIKLMNGKKD